MSGFLKLSSSGTGVLADIYTSGRWEGFLSHIIDLEVQSELVDCES